MTIPAPIAPVQKPGSTALIGCTWLPGPGTTLGASGVLSATSTSVTEAWAQTTQTLDIEYVRVPRATIAAAVDKFGLTQFSAVDNINSTAMYNVATVYNKTEKVYLPVGTSGFIQYQQFELNAVSADIYGATYGDVSGFVMGPQGSIATKRPYLKSEKWDDVVHTEHDFLQVGTAFGLLDTSTMVWYNGANLDDPLPWYVVYRDFWRNVPYISGGLLHLPRKLRQTSMGAANYTLYGGYLTTAEDAWEDDTAGKLKLVNYIEAVCNAFTASQWYNRMCIVQPVVSDGNVYTVVEADRVVQNVYYDTMRHDYTTED